MNPLFRLTLILFPLFIPKPAICQNITGQITNKEHKKIEFATINLYKDTSLIATTITDSTGGYIFNGVPDGIKRMQVSSIGYSNQEITFGNHRDTVINLQLIEEKNLKEIVVNSKKKLIEKKGDRLVFNVENSIMASSMDAFTALQNTPGVIITENAIRLIGKGSVSLMIDEKINHLPTDALINFLKNLPASDIAKIEIIANPPAQYEAQGNYGLINIVMKKSVRLGYNGDVYAKCKQTAYPMYKTGTSFYYDKAKTKVNAGVNWGDGSYKQSITNTVNYPF
ncbi:carboxypeptidase regulatory-like domain-containing protein [Chitinophaga sp.]|uniref:carboxypeptidase regulatory-like domain-containing protein n=1 Tax=Chitinophaga sp. TaxID=1869181 RepID=UPI0031D59E61